MQATYFIFAFVTPVLFLLSLLVLWIVPLKLKVQKKVFFFAEIAHAWSAGEVFIVSILAALLEIRQFALFMIGNKCT